MTHDPVASLGLHGRRSRNWFAPLTAVAGMVATVAAVTVGAVLAVFAAAAVAIFALCAAVVLFFAGFALRARRQVGGRARRADDLMGDPADGVIGARKVGDTWVTYGWDRSSR